MGEMKVAKIAIGPNERLATISKEHHIRKQKGHYRVYLVEDKLRNVLLMGQKIADLAAAVNDYVPAPEDKVSVTGLYQIIGSNGERCGGWSKHRWKCSAHPIEKGAEVFNSARAGFENAIVLGTKECYSTVCV